MYHLLMICGSLRAASSSRAVAEALADRLPAGVTCERADIASLPHYNADVTDDAAVAKLIEQIDGADGVLFVTPEYNYSIPGVLKNAIDWASRPAYASVFKDKPALVISVSGGALGGVRAQNHLKYVLNGMLAAVHPCQEVLIMQANAKVTAGRFADAAALDVAADTLADFVSRSGARG